MADRSDSHDESVKSESQGSQKRQPATVRGQLLGLAWWKKLILILAILCMAAGVALPFVMPEPAAPLAADHPQPTEPGTGRDLPPGLAPPGFLPTQPPPPGETPDPAADDAGRLGDFSPALFRLGFSFVIGFAIAFALRSFIKITLLVIGLLALFLFGLEYAALVEINWGAIGQHYDSFSAWLSAETASFRDFVTGRLPSAASAITGLGIGFTRK